MEIDLHVDLDGYCHSVLMAWFEPPFPNSFNRLFVQAHPQRTLHANVMGPIVKSND